MQDGPRYERFEPPAALAGTIDHLWMIEGPAAPFVRREILIPNGRPSIVFSLWEPGERTDPETGATLVNRDLVSGVQTRPVVLSQQSASSYLAAQLHPHGVACVLEGRNRLVDGTMPLSQIWGEGAVASFVQEARDTEFGKRRADCLGTFLAGRLSALAPAVLEPLMTATRIVDEAEGDIEVGTLVARADHSENRLYRLFKAHLGISPKTYIGIMRYYHFVGGLLSHPMEGGMAKIEKMAAYYDQAHANKDFKRFTGVSPGVFRDRLNGIARLMHQEG